MVWQFLINEIRPVFYDDILRQPVSIQTWEKNNQLVRVKVLVLSKRTVFLATFSILIRI